MTFNFLSEWTPVLLQGLSLTIGIWFLAAVISLSLGTGIGIIRSDRFRIAYVSRFFDGLCFVFRGVPFYVQLLVAYFMLPDLLGINLSPLTAGVASLGICSAAYVSQMVRSGINTIPSEQWDTAKVLGLNNQDLLRYVIMPQSMRAILPSVCAEFDHLLKSTSIISAIGVLELTRAGMNIIARDMQVVYVYVTIAALYLALSSVLNAGLVLMEKRYSYDVR